jgi:hypothetical protein
MTRWIVKAFHCSASQPAERCSSSLHVWLASSQWLRTKRHSQQNDARRRNVLQGGTMLHFHLWRDMLPWQAKHHSASATAHEIWYLDTQKKNGPNRTPTDGRSVTMYGQTCMHVTTGPPWKAYALQFQLQYAASPSDMYKQGHWLTGPALHF